jgi:hypothetical protein
LGGWENAKLLEINRESEETAMGYYVSSILAVSPNDTHSYFLYFIPGHDHELKTVWISDWIQRYFTRIASSVGPKGVIIAPSPNKGDEYLESLLGVFGGGCFFSGAYDDVMNKPHHLRGDDWWTFDTLHNGLPYLIVARTPLQEIKESGSNSNAVLINLARYSHESEIGQVFDIIISAIKQDDWSSIEGLKTPNEQGNISRDIPEGRDIKVNDVSREFKNLLDQLSQLSIKRIKEQSAQEVVNILFLAADPTNASRLRLGEELREIQEKLQLAKLRERFELHQRMSIRPTDISQALLDIQPKIVHFSGHGMASGALCFENQLGEMHPIQPDALAALFEQFSSQVNCVILNACYSEIQANAIAKHINYVIGMNQAIGDKAAIAFAVGFYQAMGGGRTIEEGYKLGCVQIRLQNIPEHLTPVLIKRQ